MKKKISGEVIAIIIAVYVCAAILLAWGFGSNWGANKDIKTWFNNWGAGSDNLAADNSQHRAPGVSNVASGASLEEVSAFGDVVFTSKRAADMQLSISSLEDVDEEISGYSLHVEPSETVIDTRMEFELAWDMESELSEWALNKDVAEYIQVIQTEENGVDFVLNALQAYACPAKLHIWLVSDSTVDCTVVLDYLKRAEFNEGYVEGTPALRLCWYNEIPVSYTYENSIGTLQGDIYFGGLELSFAEGLNFGPFEDGSEYSLSGASCTLSTPQISFSADNLEFCRAINAFEDNEISYAFDIVYVFNGETVKSERVEDLCADISLEGIYDVENDVYVAPLTLPEECIFEFARAVPYGDSSVLRTFGKVCAGADDDIYMYFNRQQYTYGAVFEAFGDVEFIINDKNGAAVTNAKKNIGTGMILLMGDYTFTIVDRGDLDGNGFFNMNDRTKYNRYISGESTPTILELYAGDLNKDGVLTEEDKELFNKVILGL